jgi:hypothetical protein
MEHAAAPRATGKTCFLGSLEIDFRKDDIEAGMKENTT